MNQRFKNYNLSYQQFGEIHFYSPKTTKMISGFFSETALSPLLCLFFRFENLILGREDLWWRRKKSQRISPQNKILLFKKFISENFFSARTSAGHIVHWRDWPPINLSKWKLSAVSLLKRVLKMGTPNLPGSFSKTAWSGSVRPVWCRWQNLHRS